MARNAGIMVALGAAVIGGLLLARRTAASTGMALTGRFGIQAKGRGIPEAVVFNGLPHATAIVSFNGTLRNSGTGQFFGNARLEVFSDSPLPIASQTIQADVPAGGSKTLALSAQIDELDTPGSVVAAVSIIRANGDLNALLTSPVLAVIEGVPSVSLTGNFGIG